MKKVLEYILSFGFYFLFFSLMFIASSFLFNYFKIVDGVTALMILPLWTLWTILLLSFDKEKTLIDGITETIGIFTLFIVSSFVCYFISYCLNLQMKFNQLSFLIPPFIIYFVLLDYKYKKK